MLASAAGPGCSSSEGRWPRYRPASPRVAVSRKTSTPSDAYFASVPPTPRDSSSGWASTAINRGACMRLLSSSGPSVGHQGLRPPPKRYSHSAQAFLVSASTSFDLPESVPRSDLRHIGLSQHVHAARLESLRADAPALVAQLQILLGSYQQRFLFVGYPLERRYAYPRSLQGRRDVVIDHRSQLLSVNSPA